MQNVSQPAQNLNWGASALRVQLATLLPGLTVDIVPRCVSTNAALLERIRYTASLRQADSKPCLLVAENQTGGRGRGDRSWLSSPGASLTFSLALPLAPIHWSGLSLAVSVAMADALQPIPSGSGLTLALKWPNDLYLVDSRWRSPNAPHGSGSGRKLGGILLETLWTGRQRFAVIGIGLNVSPLPHLIATQLNHGAASLQELDPLANPPTVLARIALPLLQALRTFERDGFAPFAARYATRDLLLDLPVSATHAGLSDATARGVSSQGALRVETETGLHLIHSGEVSVRVASIAET